VSENIDGPPKGATDPNRRSYGAKSDKSIVLGGKKVNLSMVNFLKGKDFKGFVNYGEGMQAIQGRSMLGENVG